jgi:hypothetical protein
MVVVLLAGLVAFAAGCSFELVDDVPLQGEPQIAGDAAPSEGVVTVRFRNPLDREAVDVEFYATNEPLDALPDDLFVGEYLVTASVGVAGTGIIQPLKQDVIQFPCTEVLTIGTGGGHFIDHETGEVLGSGTPRWLQEGPLALCGGVVTFEFSVADGEYTTVVAVGD